MALTEQACIFLAYPGMATLDALQGLLENQLMVILAIVAFIVLLGIAVFLTSFEILELIPVLSVIIDWLELFLSEGGVLLVLYLLFSIGVALQVVPICGGVL